MEMIGDKIGYSSAYHPQKNDHVEVINGIIGNLLRCLTKEYGQTWDQLVSQPEFFYNDSVNKTIGKSPFQIVYGYHPRGICELRESKKHKEVSGHADDFDRSMREVHEQIKKTLSEANQKIKVRMDERRRDILFEVGDCVLVHLIRFSL